MSNKPVNAATTQAVAVATGPDCVMPVAGANVLRMTPPAGSKCVAGDAFIRVDEPKAEIQIWLVPGAPTVDAAVSKVATVIPSEFKDFKPTRTTDLAVAGSAAKRLTGPGHEADDGDPGEADLIVFKVGDHVFVACTHGESVAPVAREEIQKLVLTARQP